MHQSADDSEHQSIIELARESYADDKLVLFVGSGVSQGSGLPGWIGLVRPLAEELGDPLGDEPDASVLTKTIEHYEIKRGRGTLEAKLSSAIKKKVDPNPIHDLIAQSSIKKIYTTNYDNLIEKGYDKLSKDYYKVHKAEDLPDVLPPAIIKICGDIDDASSLIASFSDYHNIEVSKDAFLTSLKTALLESCVMFIGYSLSDPFLEKLCVQVDQLTNGSNNVIAIATDWSIRSRDIWLSRGVRIIPTTSVKTESGVPDFSTPVLDILMRIFQDTPRISSEEIKNAGIEQSSFSKNRPEEPTDNICKEVYSYRMGSSDGDVPNPILSEWQSGPIPIRDSVFPEIESYAHLRLEKAKKKLNFGMLSDARSDFEDLLDLPGIDETFTQRIWLNIALSYHYNGETEAAKKFLLKGLELKGDRRRAIIFRALLSCIEKDVKDVPAMLEEYVNEGNTDAIILSAEAIEIDSGLYKAFEFLENHPSEDLHVARFIANLHRTNGNFVESESIVREIIEKEPGDYYSRYVLGSSIAFPIFSQGETSHRARYSLTRDDRLRLSEAYDYLKEAEAQFLHSQQSTVKVGIYINCSACASGLGYFNQANDFARKGLVIDPNAEELLVNLFTSLASCDSFSEAAEVGIRLYELTRKEEELGRVLLCFLASNEIENAGKWLEIWSNAFRSPSVQYYIHKSGYLRKLQRLDDAEEVIEEGSLAYPDSAFILLEKAEVLSLTGGHEAAKLCFQKAKSSARGHEAYLVRQTFGVFYFSQKEWALAAKELFNRESEDPVQCPNIERYLVCLYNEGMLEEAIDILLYLFREGIKESVLLLDLAAQINYRRKNIGEACRFTKKAIEVESSIERYLLLIELYHRSGAKELASKVADTASRIYSDSKEINIRASFANHAFGKYRRAFDQAKRSVQIAPESIKARERLVETGMMGDGLELTSEEAQLVRDSLDLLVKSKKSSFELIKIDDDFTEIRKRLKERRDQADALSKEYKEKEIPLCVVKQVMNCSYFELWAACRAGVFGSVKMAQGTRSEQDEEIVNASAGSAISLDLSALLTLRLIDSLELVAKLYSRVVVPWSIYESVINRIDELNESRSGHSMHYNNGQIVVHEATNEERKTKLEFLGPIRMFLESDDVELSGTTAEEIEKEESKVYANAFGEEFLAPIINSMATGVRLYSDEWPLREYSKKKYGIGSFCTQALLRVATTKGLLSENSYNQKIAILVRNNYRFVSETELTLWKCLEIGKFEVDDVLIRSIEKILELDGCENINYRMIGAFSGLVWFNLGERGDGRARVLSVIAGVIEKLDYEKFEKFILHFVVGYQLALVQFPELAWGLLHQLAESKALTSKRCQILDIAHQEAGKVLGRFHSKMGNMRDYRRLQEAFNMEMELREMGVWGLDVENLG